MSFQEFKDSFDGHCRSFYFLVPNKLGGAYCFFIFFPTPELIMTPRVSSVKKWKLAWRFPL